jgi:hypothetical protein
LIAAHAAAWRVLLPREHGLVAWVALPQLAAVALAPRTWGAGVAVLAGFGLFNAVRRGGSRGALPVTAGVALVGFAAVLAGAPEAAGSVLLAAAAAAIALQGPVTRSTPLEAGAISSMALLAWLQACLGGAEPARAAAVLTGVAAWELCGLAWVQGALARILPRRRPDPVGPTLAGIGVLAAVLAAGWSGRPLAGLLAAAYPARALIHPRAAAPADVRRIGLEEAVWSVAVLAGLLLA